MYRLAITGESNAQLNNTVLREWLRRAGFSCNSGWPGPPIVEDVWFGGLYDNPPVEVPHLALGGDIAFMLTGYNLPIKKVRGSILPKKAGGWLLVTIRPEDVGFDKAQDELKPLLGADARRAIDTQHSGPRVPTVSCLSAPDRLAIPSPGTVVSVDIEGANGRPNIVGISWQEEVAYVLPWSDSLRQWLSRLFASGVIPTFHNASYDVAELEEAGVVPPKLWYDTINMAALYDPDQPKNLQTQVLTHVPGSVAWKGLVNHEKGPDYDGEPVRSYRNLWTDVLTRLGRKSPQTGTAWYKFYNGLDTAWGLALANNFKRKLEAQGRWDYYEQVMMPLQRPLLEIGSRGMPVDEAKVAEHRVACQAKVDEAAAVLLAAGQDMIVKRNGCIQDIIDQLEAERLTEQALTGKRGFSKAKDLTKVRNKLKPKKSKTKAGIKVKDPGVFDPSSNLQRCALLYDWYGLPPVKNYGAKGFTTDEKAVLELISRLERGTAKPSRGSVDEVKGVLQAMTDINQWGVLISTFLQPELRG